MIDYGVYESICIIVGRATGNNDTVIIEDSSNNLIAFNLSSIIRRDKSFVIDNINIGDRIEIFHGHNEFFDGYIFYDEYFEILYFTVVNVLIVNDGEKITNFT